MGKRGTHKILVVDDDAGMLDLVENILSAKNYDILRAQSGKNALEIMAAEPDIDLTIADVRMPGMSGLELLDQAKVLMTHPKFILISAFGDLAMKDAYSWGACGFLAKPFDSIELLLAVEGCFKQSPGWDRRNFRYDIRLQVALTSKEVGGGVICQTENIGQAGMFVAMEPMLQTGNIVHFKVIFGEGEFPELSGMGKVVWVREKTDDSSPCGVGILFLDNTEKQRDFIRSFVKERCIDSLG